jgi:cytochrome c553
VRPVLVFLLTAIAFTAAADPKQGEKKAQLCLVCHNTKQAQAKWTPQLEGQPAAYLVAQTIAIKSGARLAPGMGAYNAAQITENDIRQIAEYLSARPAIVAAYPVDPAKAAAGELRAAELKCATCHGRTYHGTDVVPRLASQAPGYLSKQLENFTEGRRKHPGDRMSLTPVDMENISSYMATLK